MALHLKEIYFKYPRAKTDTIKDLSLEISSGELVAILGDSGSGKSTVLRLIAGLEVPRGGEIYIDQKEVAGSHYLPPEKRNVGMVFQDYALFPHLTVAKNVAFGLNGHKDKKNQRVKELLHLVGLDDFSKRYPHELSGGQQQRVAIARALAPRPDILLLDEPFSNLDASLQDSIRSELRRIVKDTGVTAIFVTHDQEDALAIADRVMVLQDGEKTLEGSPDLLAERP